MPLFSTVIITKNEAANIERTLVAINQVCTDVIVVDSGSTDATVAVAKRLGATVVPYHWEGYAANKNLGAKYAQHDWILSIDADEVLSDALIQTLNGFSPKENEVYELDRITNYCGDWIYHSGWYPDYKIRLYNRKRVHWQGEFVHETLSVPHHFKIVPLSGKLLHYSYTSSQDHWDRIEKYAQLSAQQLHSKGKKATFIKRYLAPAFRFFRTLILKKGILDGKNGWVISRRNAYLVRRKYQLLGQLKSNDDSSHHLTRPRILHISSAKTWRGGEQQLAYLVQELQQKGIHQIIFCVQDAAMHQFCQTHQIPFQTYQKRSSINPLVARQIKAICKKQSIDIIHTHDAHAHTFAFIAATLFRNKTPIVVSRRVDFPIKKGWLSYQKYNHPSIKKIVCVSDAIRQITSPDIKDKSKLEVVYSGIDLERFPYPASSILKTAYNIPSDVALIGNVSAIAPHKDYFTFVDTVEILVKQNLKVHFFIIGKDDGEGNQIRSYIQQKNLQNHITLTGFRNDIPKILPDLDVFLITSKTEGLGTSILDAFACSVPIVATNAGGISELVIHNQTGLLTEVGNAEALARHVHSILNDKELKQRLVSSAGVHLKKFTKEETAERTLELYKDLGVNR